MSKRFYAAVTVEPVGDDFGIALDGRNVNTPGRQRLVVPTAPLAQAIADEWAAQGDQIDPRTMPLTGLANATVERVLPDLAAFAGGIAAYAEADLFCYRADDPPALVARQSAAWDPWLDRARRQYGVTFVLATGVLPVDQPAATQAALGTAVASCPAHKLAPLSVLTTLSGSLIAGLALVDDPTRSDALWDAICVDELWQAEQWGEDAEATAARSNRRRDWDAAVTYIRLQGDDAARKS